MIFSPFSTRIGSLIGGSPSIAKYKHVDLRKHHFSHSKKHQNTVIIPPSIRNLQFVSLTCDQFAAANFGSIIELLCIDRVCCNNDLLGTQCANSATVTSVCDSVVSITQTLQLLYTIVQVSYQRS